ncbi:sigma-E factor regulatory protein RseB domain-containing protein [Cohnella kolymensis]|uniref:sigma-E factor regulatory protein RseB domain-containing protein n=1 Tax=Cohnella kolymensis TaxID=1590652 RepID=UPI000695DB7C|nr:sigma-E factor regulatory protein RseB domain-containing protein [Cohnella kolymensis]
MGNYDWEKRLKAPASTGGSDKAWMNTVHQRVKHKSKKLKGVTPMVVSGVVAAVLFGVLLTNFDYLRGLVTGFNPETKITASQSPIDELPIPANYPPRNKAFGNQEQLTEEEQQKAEFLQRMAYAYQKVLTLKGTAIDQNKSFSFSDTIEFQIRQGKYPASYEKVTASDGTVSEFGNNNEFIWHQSNGNNQISRVQPRNTELEPSMPFFSTSPDGIPTYSLPTDPARSDRGQNIVAPLRNLGWMLNDLKLWSLKNSEVYLSRKVNVVEGTLPKDMAEKFRASKYKLWIDEATGMLLKKQLFDKNDVVTESFVVTSIQVDQRLDKGIIDVPTDLKAVQEPRSVPVPSFPTNENGQTYGSASDATSPETEPDLIKAHGVDGTEGYVLKTDLDGEMPRNPQEALAQQESRPAGGRDIPLYDVDGETVIGVFHIGP